MHNREEFHNKLKEVSGVDNVYFQPPEKFLMKYPAIRYNFDDVNKVYADNDIYSLNKAYQVIVIDKDPESEIVEKIIKMKYCTFIRSYVSDGLYHTIFKIYY